MRCFVLGNDDSIKEFFGDAEPPTTGIPEGVALLDSDVLLDLREEAWDMEQYQRFPGLVFVNAVIGTLMEHNTPANVVRINGWPGMLSKPSVEAAGDPSIREKAEQSMATWGKQVLWVADQSGLVSPRVLAMIINEAFIALEEEVSERDAIDIAMKLGTNYPKGPFEWADQVGQERISRLLNTFAPHNSRYTPAKQLEA